MWTCKPAAQPAQPKMPEPTACALVLHNVKAFDAWKPVFDAEEQVRKDAGFMGHGLARVVDNPGRVMVWLPTDDLDQAQAFTKSKELKAKMKEAGVVGAPTISLLNIVENEPSHDAAAKYGAIVTHKVADYDGFKAVFDDSADIMTAASIVGHSVAQDATNPNLVTVWVEATDLDKLKAFLNGKDIKAKMKEAGVKGPPTITVVETGEMKFYQ